MPDAIIKESLIDKVGSHGVTDFQDLTPEDITDELKKILKSAPINNLASYFPNDPSYDS